MRYTNPSMMTGTWRSASDLVALKDKSGTHTGQVVHGRRVVTALDGTFILQFNGGVKPTGATTSEVNGRFVLKKGTGAYAGLHGTGKIHATRDSASGAISAVYTGKAHVGGGS